MLPQEQAMYDKGYSDGFEDASMREYDKECNIYHAGAKDALQKLEEYIEYYEGMTIPYDTVMVLCERTFNDILHSTGEI